MNSSKLWFATAIATATFAGIASAQLTKLSGAMTSGGNVTTFASTSGNTSVVFRSNRESASRFDLWRNSVSAGSSVVKLSGTMVAGGNVRPEFKITGGDSLVVFRADSDAVGDVGLWSAEMSGPGGGTPNDIAQLPAGRNVYDGFELTSGTVNTRAVFISNREAVGRRDLWIASVDGSGAPLKLSSIAVNATRDVQAFVISPDNNKVAFNGDLNDDGRNALYVADSITGVATRIYQPAAGENVLNTMQFNADGSLVVFRLDRGAGGIELLRVPTTGGSAYSLSGPVAAGRRVKNFQLDGASVTTQKVVFIGDISTTGVDDLYAVDLDGVAALPVNLSASIAIPSYDVVSFKLPSEIDGKVAFDVQDNGNGRRSLWATDTTVSGPPSSPAAMAAPNVGSGEVYAYEINRDGTLVVFVSDRETNGKRELWSRAGDGLGLPLKLSGAIVSGGNVANDISLISIGSNDIAFYRADALQDEQTELWRVKALGGAPVRLSGAMHSFADVDSFFSNSGRVYFIANREISTQKELFTSFASQTTTLDIDGSGQIGALNDGLMISRFLLGLRGTAVTTGAYVGGSVRGTSLVDKYLYRLLSSTAP
jgi:hypothetical protein